MKYLLTRKIHSIASSPIKIGISSFRNWIPSPLVLPSTPPLLVSPPPCCGFLADGSSTSETSGGGSLLTLLLQVAANYVAVVPSGQMFDSSLEKGLPYIFRVGSGQVIKGLDEGIPSMKVGGKHHLYIPGSLAFPKGLASAPGRPRAILTVPSIVRCEFGIYTWPGIR